MDSLPVSRDASSTAAATLRPDSTAGAAPDWKAWVRLSPAQALKQADADASIRRERPGLPAWVWFLTVGLGVNPVATLILLLGFVRSYFHGMGPLFGHGFMQLLLLLALHLPLMALTGLIPLGAIFYGSLSVFFPALRQRRLEAQYMLSDFQPVGPVQLAIFACIKRHMPGVQITANLKNTGLLAFVYPGRKASARLAIFGGLLLLWQRDREAAEAVLVHELAHLRRGEALHMGTGSGLESGLRVGAIAAAAGLALWTLLGLVNVKLLLLTGLNALSGFGIFSVLVAAFWCAEFQADRMAAEELGSSAGLLRAMELSPERGPWWKRALARLSHPPLSWRRAMLARSPERAQLFGNLVLLGGLALRDLLFGLSAWGTYVLLGHDGAHEIGAGMSYEETIWTITGALMGYMVIAMACLFWPLLHYRYASAWSRERVAAARTARWPAVLSSTVAFWLGIAFFVFYIATYEEALGAPMEDPAIVQQRARQRDELMKSIMQNNEQILQNWQNQQDGSGYGQSLGYQESLGDGSQTAPPESSSTDSGGADSGSAWDSFGGYDPNSNPCSSSSESGYSDGSSSDSDTGDSNTGDSSGGDSSGSSDDRYGF